MTAGEGKEKVVMEKRREGKVERTGRRKNWKNRAQANEKRKKNINN